MRRSLTIVSILVALAVLLSAAPVGARSKIALGVSDPNRTVQQHIDQLIAQGGAKADYQPALWSLWSTWGSRGGQAACQVGRGSCAFPTAKAGELLARGITPVIWWQPTWDDPGKFHNGKYARHKNIAAGKHDAYIRKWATDLRNLSRANGNKPIMVRLMHEATGYWFPWGIGRFDNTNTTYKSAWRHVVKLFRKVGARKHAKFIWSNYAPRPAAYPGDADVDYIGFTVLNFGSQKKWRSMPKVVNSAMRLAKKTSRKRPVMLSEVASHFKGGNKAGWLRQGYASAYKLHPRIKAIMYLDTRQAQVGQRHPDWRLAKPDDGSALRAYAYLTKQPRFTGRMPK